MWQLDLWKFQLPERALTDRNIVDNSLADRTPDSQFGSPQYPVLAFSLSLCLQISIVIKKDRSSLPLFYFQTEILNQKKQKTNTKQRSESGLKKI